MAVGSTISSFGQVTDLPTIRAYRSALAAICIYALATLSLVPFSTTPVADVPALTPIFSSVVVTTDLSSSFLLFAMFHEVHRVSLLILGCAYLYAGSLATLNLLTFPGALRSGGVVFGTLQTSAWAYLLWMVGFAALSLAAIVVEYFERSRPLNQKLVAKAIGVSLALLLAGMSGIVVMTTRYVEYLPPLMQGSAFTGATTRPRVASIVMMVATVAIGASSIGRRSSIFLWLSVAVTATLCTNVLTLTSGGRGSLGWSLGRASLMFSACILFWFFIGQFAVQLRVLSRSKDALEHRVQARTADLTRIIQQRDLLLREVNHRVKNNMQVIDSMLFLERRRTTEPATKNMIDLLRNRVLALGLVHQQLMSSDNLEDFDIAPFLRQLVDNLGRSEGVAERGITLEVEVTNMLVNLDIAIPIGLITTELVTEGIRHAARHVSAEFRQRHEDSAMLAVAYDRSPTDAEQNSQGCEISSMSGRGGLIVAGLVGQLDGRLNVTQDTNMRVEIVLPLPERD